MLTSLKKVFGGTLKFIVETYGKLPFYKDYIAVVTSGPALQWKSFLLDNFGQDGMKIPQGRWPFIFQAAPRADLVVGFIEASSDGIREFPFSIFTVCKSGRGEIPYCQETVSGIWQKLYAIRKRLASVQDIGECYGIIRGRTILVEVGKKNVQGEFRVDRSGDWPRLLVAKIGAPLELFMIKDAYTSPHGFIDNWNALSGERAKVEVPQGKLLPDCETTQEFKFEDA